MTKYIDAEKLKAEVKALKRRKGFLSFENTEITEAYMARGVQLTCDDIVNLIQSLQLEQPEVDLEKEIEEHVKGMPMSEFTHESEIDDYWGWAREEFRYFFELGLNARKEG